MEARILTLHPQGKQGVSILQRRYDCIKDFILHTLQEADSLPFSLLTQRATAELSGQFDGSIPWYIVTVKLDLEARGIIERVPKQSPQAIRLSR